MDVTIGNQQVKITREWLAGFYDGEGCLSLIRRFRKDKGYQTFSPQIDLTNTNQEVMEAIVNFLESHEISVYVNKTKKHPKFHRDNGRCHKQRMIIRIARMANIRKFLIFIIPHLVLKRQQALLLLEFVNTRAEGYTKVSKRDYEIANELYLLNGKGVIESSEANTPDSES
jgi:hypothetical protein